MEGEGARKRGLKREGNRRKRRGGCGKGRRPSDEFSGTRPLWRGGVAAQTLEKKNRRGPRGRKAARAPRRRPGGKKRGRLRGLERGRKMRAAARTVEESDVALRCGESRNPLSRKSSPLFLSPALFPNLSSLPRALSPLATNVHRLAPALPTFRVPPSPFRHGNHPFGASRESSPPPRCRLEYRNSSVGAKGYGGKKGLAWRRRWRGARRGWQRRGWL